MAPKVTKNQTSWLKSKIKDKTFWEKSLWKDQISLVAGLDEAGRGAWVGPVVAAAVIFHPFKNYPEIDDSKKLSPQKREFLYDLICREALAFGVGVISSSTIDEVNILQATLLAMKEAVEKLQRKPEFLLIDGNAGINISIPQKTIVKGDANSLSIGAASILAKVTRDRLMCDLGKAHPQFQFSKHKGYGTTQHRREIQEHGLISEHRKSFEPMRSLIKV